MESFGEFTHSAKGTSQTGHEKSAVGLQLSGSIVPSTSFFVVAPVGVANIGEKPSRASPATCTASIAVAISPRSRAHDRTVPCRRHHAVKAPALGGRKNTFLPASFSSLCAFPTSSWKAVEEAWLGHTTVAS